jgi:hypothetical protein
VRYGNTVLLRFQTDPLPVHSEDLGADWRPPACTGWSDLAFDQVVGLAGRFRSPDDAQGILARFGRLSQLTRIRYWSVSHGACRDLIDEAFALAGPDADQRRRDFSEGELAAGRILYFFQDDNGPGGGTVYRLDTRGSRGWTYLPDRRSNS